MVAAALPESAPSRIGRPALVEPSSNAPVPALIEVPVKLNLLARILTSLLLVVTFAAFEKSVTV